MKTNRHINAHVTRQPMRVSSHSKRNYNRVIMRKTKLKYGHWNTQTLYPQTEEVRPPKMTI